LEARELAIALLNPPDCSVGGEDLVDVFVEDDDGVRGGVLALALAGSFDFVCNIPKSPKVGFSTFGGGGGGGLIDTAVATDGETTVATGGETTAVTGGEGTAGAGEETTCGTARSGTKSAPVPNKESTRE